MFGNPHPIALPGNLVKLCLTDSEMFGNSHGIYFFCKMFLNVHINLHGQFLLMQRYHPFHAQIDGHGLHDVGGGSNIILRNDWLSHTGCFQSLQVKMVVLTTGLNLFPALFVGRAGEDMAKEQVADHNIAKDDGSDTFRQSRVALIGVRSSAFGGCLTGRFVTVMALGGRIFV